MKNKLSILFCLILSAAGIRSFAQVDPHFSQYYANPMWLNPALTGVIDGDYRVTANYRNQWNNLDKPFSTVGLSGEFVTNKNLNLGVNILDQSAGNAGYHLTTGYASLSYTGMKFGAQGYQRVTFGLQAGVLNRRFDPSKLQFGDAWDPINGYNPGGSLETFNKTSKATFDAGAGILYYDGDPSKQTNLYGGFSAFHLTQPKDPYGTGEQEKMPMRYLGHAGAKIRLNEDFSLTPNAIYMRQGKSSVKMLGAYAEMKANTFVDVMVGANYRIDDAVVAFAGLHYNNFVLGVSYDANVSNLNKVAGASNAFEISLSFIGRRSKQYGAEHFICPRL